MPYVFQVLCCNACETFQVHQVKKAKKWECKMCGAKQSLIKAFKVGTPRECRELVQQLNMEKGRLREKANDSAQQNDYQQMEFENNFFRPERNQNTSESEEEELIRKGCENRSPIAPGLVEPSNADSTYIHQPSSLQNTVHALYCAMGMNDLNVCKSDQSRENETISRDGASIVATDKPVVGSPKATINRKNKGFELIKEAAKRRKKSIE